MLSPTLAQAPRVVQWTEDMLQAFSSIKCMFCHVTDLCIPVPSDGFRLYTDTSARGVGAALYMVKDGKELPISFYSRLLSGAEKGYSATELEGFAIYLTLLLCFVVSSLL